jgi:LuxR family transcriptional regulator, maltose regulon positive regulatory protein
MVTSSGARVAARSRGQATAADDPVLMSKITVPGVPAWAVSRPQIDQLIADGARGPLTTVTGPPGSGKTLAIASWAAANSDPATLVWITLDDYDNRPKVFWSYVVAAMRRAGIAVPRVHPTSGRESAVDHVFLLRLASVLAAQDPPVVAILDDLHLLTEQDTLDGLAYVLRNATPGLRLVVSSRMDPLLPLHRYRLAGELTEIRADDLAFSVPESAMLMAQQGITLSADALERVVVRTEGWAAGIRLAAISLHGHPDPEQFVKELDAEESAVTSYLVDEVLNAQPAAHRELLLRTSILDTVSADIASELADVEPSTAGLPDLARANAFVRPVGHGWYRYHSLLTAVLRLKLRREYPGLAPELHRRAALWYLRNGSLSEAVRHAGESGDWLFAARIAVDELAIGRLIEPRGNRSLAEEFRRMPQDLTWTQPQPLLVAAAIELSGTEGVPSGAGLDAAEGILERLPADDEIPSRLAAALIRLAVSRRVVDLDAATAAAVRAEALLQAIPESHVARHPEIRAQVLSGRGVVELWAGHLDEAAAILSSAATAVSPAIDGTYAQADCLGYLALVEALRGRLSHAAELADEAVGAAENSSDGLAEPTIPAANVALAYVHLERNELRQAHGQLRLADGALRIAPDNLVGAIACQVAARCQLAEGVTRAALEMVSRARQGWSLPRWLERRLTLIQSRAYAAAGDVQSAVDLAERAEPRSALDAAVTLAHARLAAADYQGAWRALAAGAASPGEPAERVRLEGWLIDARLSYGGGDGVRGRRSLEQALRLGRPEQLRLAFAMERAWIRPVLRRDPELAHAYQGLLGTGLTTNGWLPIRSDTGQAAPVIVEQLSEREREVLRHLSRMLSTAEIATEMYISVNTVKTHLRSIYRKLSAAHRGEAVRRAKQLELI